MPAGSPVHERNSSPIPLRKDSERGADDRRKKDEGRDLDRDSERSNYGRSGDSYRHSDRQSSRSSRNYHRHDDYHRRDKYVDEDDRDHSRSSRSGRVSRSHTYSDHSRRESEYRSRDHPRDADKYARDKSDGVGERGRDKERDKDSSSEYQKHREKDLSSDRAGSGRKHTNSYSEDVKHGERDRYIEDKVGRDEKIDRRRTMGDNKSDRAPAYEESRGHRNDLTSKRENSGHQLREASRLDAKSLDNEKKNSDDRDRYKEHHRRQLDEPYEEGKGHFSKDDEFSAKKQKLFSLDGDNSNGTLLYPLPLGASVTMFCYSFYALQLLTIDY